MKISYNVKIPAETKNMGENARAFYQFLDSENENMCLEFDTKTEAKSCRNCISSIRYRKELPVEVKMVDNKVYVWRVADDGRSAQHI